MPSAVISLGSGCFFMSSLPVTELTCLERNEDDGREGSLLWYCSFSTLVHFISKIPFLSLHCPRQLVLNSFVGGSVAVKSVHDSWNITGNHKLSSKKVASNYLFISFFYFPVAKGTTLGSETRLEVCICTREWRLFSFFPFFFFVVVVSCYLGEWLLSEHAQFGLFQWR